MRGMMAFDNIRIPLQLRPYSRVVLASLWGCGKKLILIIQGLWLASKPRCLVNSDSLEAASHQARLTLSFLKVASHIG